MNPEQLTALIKEIFFGLGLLIGALGTLYTAITAKKKANQADLDRKLAHEKEKKKEEVDLTEKLQMLSQNLLDQMNERVSALEVELEKSRKREALLRSAGLRLISGIEASIKARKDSDDRDGSSCAACLSGDQALLREVIRVKELFEREGK